MGSTLLCNLVLFAAKEGAKKSSGLDLMSFLVPMMIIGFLFYFLLLRPQQREQSKRRMMLSSVKKNARVLTASGIYGVVTNIHAEADEVTIKVDEANNTKLRMTLSSIYRVLGDESSEDK